MRVFKKNKYLIIKNFTNFLLKIKFELIFDFLSLWRGDMAKCFGGEVWQRKKGS
jgi:hypothetical protein